MFSFQKFYRTAKKENKEIGLILFLPSIEDVFLFFCFWCLSGGGHTGCHSVASGENPVLNITWIFLWVQKGHLIYILSCLYFSAHQVFIHQSRIIFHIEHRRKHKCRFFCSFYYLSLISLEHNPQALSASEESKLKNQGRMVKFIHSCPRKRILKLGLPALPSLCHKV